MIKIDKKNYHQKLKKMYGKIIVFAFRYTSAQQLYVRKTKQKFQLPLTK
jgi:hypothetical protein